MDGLGADKAGDTGCADIDLFAEQHAAVNAAGIVKAEIAVVGDACDDEADLVHVGTEHELLCRGLCALFENKDVADRIGDDLIGQRHGALEDIVPHLALRAGYTVKAAECFHGVKHLRPPPLF